MQRLHEDDLTGFALGQEPWEVLNLPAIAEQDEVFEFDTVLKSFRVQRRVGDLLHPAREPAEVLQRIRQTVGEYNFAGQYQQSPAPLGGGLVKAAWFRTYKESELPVFDQIVQSWDTANKATELSDYSVCTTWGIKAGHAYLLDVFRKRLDYPQLKRAVREQCLRYSAKVVLIEDKASGTQLIQELIGDGVHAVTRYAPEGDKVMRLHAQSGMIENGFVHLPEAAPWLAEYLHELTTFPRAKHDDQADSTSQFLEWFKRPMPSAGIYEFYRELATQAEQDQSPRTTSGINAIRTKQVLVTLRAPRGMGFVQTFSNQHLTVSADGLVEMTDEDASHLPPEWIRIAERPNDQK